MYTKLMAFLKGLEEAIPPASGIHHSIEFAEYGSAETGFEPILRLVVRTPEKYHDLFLEPRDFEKAQYTLIEDVRMLVETPALAR